MITTIRRSSLALNPAATFNYKIGLSMLLMLFCCCNELFASANLVHRPNSHKLSLAKRKPVGKSTMLALPTISYTSPKTYTINAQIAPLAPSSSGVSAPGYSNSLVNVGSGFIDPNDVATDAAGNIYVVDSVLVYKIPAGGGTQVTVGSGFTKPVGVAVDSKGNVYVMDNQNLIKVPVGGGAQVNLGTFIQARGLAIDLLGNIYISGTNSLVELPFGGGAPFNINTGGILNPVGVAVDALGNLYVADASLPGGIYKLPAGGGAKIAIGSGFSGPFEVAVDNAGNVFVADQNNGAIKEIPASGGGTITLASGLGETVGVAVDPAGNVYEADYMNKVVKEIKPIGGYYLGNPLPAGLQFDVTTGDISGTPAVISPATNYTVTAYNSSGSSSAVVSIKVIIQTPVISYSSPQSYHSGATITPLTPTNTGGAVATPAYNNSPQIFASNVSTPIGVAVDAAGNVYVALRNNTTITKIPFGGGPTVQIGSGLSAPYGVAVDATGNVYVADYGSNTVKEILASNGSTLTIGTGFNHPNGVAVDIQGNVYVGDAGNSAVKEIPAGGGVQLTLGSGFGLPFGVAVDALGNVYVCDAGASLVKKIPVGGGAPVVLGSGFNQPDGIAVDASGNVFVADAGNNAVKELPVSGGSPIILGSGFNGPQYVAVDGTGSVYVTDNNNSAVKKILPAGGYYLNTALPTGLAIDAATGIISGTPMGIFPAANYTVTAYNSSGGASAVLNIVVNGPLPIISYSSPQTYTINNAITPLVPVSGLVTTAGYANSLTNFATGFSNPRGIAIDAQGNVFIADFGSKLVKKFPVGGGTPVTITSGAVGPVGVAVDYAGNVYVADYTQNTIIKVPAGGGSPTTISSGYGAITGIAADASGNVYSPDYATGVVKKIPPGGGATVTIASGFTNPSGIAVDSLGNVYISDYTTSLITKIPPGGGTPTTLGSGFHNPYGLTVDASGNVFVADYNHDSMTEIPVGGGAPVSLNFSFNTVVGAVVDAAGDVIVADYGNPAVLEIKPNGGFYLNTPLPAGLNFSNATGTISGTPTVAGLAKNYTVTAYNGYYSNNTATVSIKITLVPLPTISYSSPQTYNVGATIAALSPTSSGATAPAFTTLPVTVGSGFKSPTGVAIDAAGNVYVADLANAAVKKIPAGGGAPVSIGAGFTVPEGVAVDAAGNVYVTDNSANTVKKIAANGGATTTIATGFNGPVGVAVDAAGNVYVGDNGNNQVKMIPLGTGTPVVIGSGFSQPAGVSVDAVGNVFVADAGNNAIKEIPVAGGVPVVLGSGFSYPTGVYVDAEGNIFVADQHNNAVKEIPAGGGAVVTLGTGFYQPLGVAGDGQGNVYVADTNHDAVKEIVPAGGFYANALPLGLALNQTSGVISGTPTVTSAAANYTVTAYNAGGGTSTTVNIKVLAPNVATLASLAISSGALKPVFSAGTTSYTVSVGNGSASFTITPTSADPIATIKVNGTAVATGTASPAIPLVVGPNTITTIVTAQDGITTKTYTITVTRAASSNATLSRLSTSNGTLSPVFAAGTASYTANVANGVASITVTPVAADPTATITINGTAVTSGSASPGLPLVVGPNTITILVTAANGTTTKTYTIVVTEAKSTNPNLASLKPGTGNISPVFASTTTSYTETVNYAVASIDITPTTLVAGATVTVNAVAVASGTASSPIALAVGSNTITTVVTAQDGVTTKTYTLTVTRSAALKNAQLSALVFSNGTLSPTFASTTVVYSTSVGAGVSSITVTPTTADVNATVTVNGAAVISGVASQSLPLAAGPNTISIVVTAQDGTTKKTYTVTVTRPAASNANLLGLKISRGTLTPGFAVATTDYTASVVNGVTSLTVTPTTADVNAVVTVDGTTVASGTASGAIALAVGSNIINTVVTAQDGVTTKTYTVTVTRAAGGADSYDPGISVSKPEETPALADDGILVHQAVSPNGDGINDFLQIDNISQYPDNKLSIMNRNGQLVYEARGYDNTSKVFDGHSNKNGQMQVPGTYFYQLDYTVSGIIKHKTGFIILKY